jgi:hypothetical protein
MTQLARPDPRATGRDQITQASALLLVGSCQIATGAGLPAARLPARVLLILTGLSTVGIAATPEPGCPAGS